MIKVENIKVYNIARAVYSARNPLNSWNKSDSDLEKDILGLNDLNLAKRLYKAGPEHRKYLRQIFVSMDITAPLYWWAEFDTYKIGVARNSCSFMHKGVSKPFDITDFSIHDERVYDILSPIKQKLTCKELAEKYSLTVSQANNIISGNITDNQELFMLCYIWEQTIEALNTLRNIYLETKDNDIFQQIRCLLPSGYNQRSTITMNYENVVTMIKQRTGHKLDEWNDLIEVFKTLPYIKEITED